MVGVSWQDAQAYVAWLAKETAKPYRLPSEAEWEYACRAGTTTPFSFGETITTDEANYGRRNGECRQRTTEVGSFPANPWGLSDMHGNVCEWVDDDWHDDYQGAPTDGSAWTDRRGKDGRVLRGGSWLGSPGGLHSAFRGRDQPVIRDSVVGFRVARTLD